MIREFNKEKIHKTDKNVKTKKESSGDKVKIQEDKDGFKCDFALSDCHSQYMLSDETNSMKEEKAKKMENEVLNLSGKENKNNNSKMTKGDLTLKIRKRLLTQQKKDNSKEKFKWMGKLNKKNKKENLNLLKRGFRTPYNLKEGRFSVHFMKDPSFIKTQIFSSKKGGLGREDKSRKLSGYCDKGGLRKSFDNRGKTQKLNEFFRDNKEKRKKERVVESDLKKKVSLHKRERSI